MHDPTLRFFAPLRMTVGGCHPEPPLCHPERSEGSQHRSGVEILRSARNDSWGSVILNAPSCHPERPPPVILNEVKDLSIDRGVGILRSAQNDSRRSVPMDRLMAELRTGSLNAYRRREREAQPT